MTDTNDLPTSFDDLGLNEDILKAVKSVGYETPSPIQAATIPAIIAGKDVLGQAQTGTGKTAAFALPMLQQIDARKKDTQILVLAPTRELAIQVAEAFQTYAANIRGINVLSIYGGADYRTQISGLKRGAQVVVGTPGRVMDHMRKGTLKLENLGHLVLDEADEMLRMGFIDDVEWVLSQTPENRQIALFSATMPKQIKSITENYLNKPEIVRIASKNKTASTISQFYWNVSGTHKLDALSRILEGTEFDAAIVFVRTKTSTVDIAERLQARGYAASALNGDIEQKNRVRTIESLKAGKIDVLIATDVAARGLDVERLSLVVNFDIPYDTEAYVHRIGRTGRAGREGSAILFVAPRERRMLQTIERHTGNKIEPMQLPSIESINRKRLEKLGDSIAELKADKDLMAFEALAEQLSEQSGASPTQTAAALLMLKEGKRLISKDKPMNEKPPREKRQKRERDSAVVAPEEGMKRYRISVGHDDDVKPGNIVGAIANEAGIDSQYIGHIKIHNGFSLVDLPDGMPAEVFDHLKKVQVCGRPMRITEDKGAPGGDRGERGDRGPRGDRNDRNKSKRRKPKKRKTNDSES